MMIIIVTTKTIYFEILILYRLKSSLTVAAVAVVPLAIDVSFEAMVAL